MTRVGVTKVSCQSGPIADLCLRVGIRLGFSRAARQRVAVDVLELRGDFADDPALAFPRELRQR